jgi:4-amino-4-deoxy-L-arabinose transferase-like glycosyltransferase
MSLGTFLLGALRLAAIVVPAWLFARTLRRTLAGGLSGAIVALADAIATLSALLVCSELLGLVGLFRTRPMIAALCLLALAGLGLARRGSGGAWRAARPAAAPRLTPAPAASRKHPPGSVVAAALGVVVVAAQWLLQSANSLGSGMLNFDTLWYHMPVAAQFARTGSVTAIQFTLADPYVAYFPSNSELLHALGIVALHGDFLSPLLNLLWLSIALLSAWCLGRRWQVEPLTLLAGSLVVSLSVLSSTQPGEAFNDIAGLACLLAGCALALDAAEETGALILAGLALGLAAGTKLTFLIPVLALVLVLALGAARQRRARVLLALAAPAALTGGWWYLRNVIAVGNPIGLGLHLGPLRLPGPSSALAAAQSQSIVSELGHLSLWGSRFLPGLDHALGPLWPLIVLLYLLGVIGGLFGVGDRPARTLALVAGLAGISYLLLPTGASGIEQDATLFEVNLRYATPALALGIPLVAVVVRLRAPQMLPALAAALALILLAGQTEHALWPTQPTRHLALLLACGAFAVILALAARRLGGRRAGTLRQRAIVTAVALIAVGGLAFFAQRHYFARRYLIGFSRNEPLGTIYRFSQGISHERLAFYGSAEQYPLYGAHDTNAVDYLGEDTGDGGYRPISSCRAWRRQLSATPYSYVVLTPAPTRSIPLSWTAEDRAAKLVLNPAPGYYVFSLQPGSAPGDCT